MEKVKCSECTQDTGNKTNAQECRCPCHAHTPAVPLKGTLYVWNFRANEMVPIETHNLIERMANK